MKFSKEMFNQSQDFGVGSAQVFEGKFLGCVQCSWNDEAPLISVDDLDYVETVEPPHLIEEGYDSGFGVCREIRATDPDGDIHLVRETRYFDWENTMTPTGISLEVILEDGQIVAAREAL